MRAEKSASKLSPRHAGRLGGLAGGKARAENSAQERKEIAKKAVGAHWSKASKQAAQPVMED